MEIILTNISSSIITIQDLGIELQANEEINLLNNFTPRRILKSNYLENLYENNQISFTIDSELKTLLQTFQALSSLSEYQHNTLNTLQHHLSQDYFFITEKDEDDNIIKIIYYKDNTLEVIIREEEIIREDDEIIQIITRQYDGDSIIQTETQTLNRENGQVISIETQMS